MLHKTDIPFVLPQLIDLAVDAEHHGWQAHYFRVETAS